MATFRVFGPFALDFGAGGLAPGQSTGTFWTTNPQLAAGTVTFTAVPLNVVGPDGGRLAVRDPTVQTEAGPVAGSSNITLHVVVANVGQNTVFQASMFISFVEV
jgi:hypothetical protein